MITQDYECSICGHRDSDGYSHTWGETALHFWREIIMGERMEMTLVRRNDDKA